MQIKKTYRGLNPQLLFDEIKDFVQKQGATVEEARIENYSVLNDSSAYIARGTLTFTTGKDEESVRVHVIGSAKTEVKLLLDINEELFSESKLTALTEDIDFVFGSYEE